MKKIKINMIIIIIKIKLFNKGAFKYYVSTFGGVGGLIKNADTADAGEGVGVFDKMLALLTLGSGGVGKLGLRAGIKRE